MRIGDGMDYLRYRRSAALQREAEQSEYRLIEKIRRRKRDMLMFKARTGVLEQPAPPLDMGRNEPKRAEIKGIRMSSRGRKLIELSRALSSSSVTAKN